MYVRTFASVVAVLMTGSVKAKTMRTAIAAMALSDTAVLNFLLIIMSLCERVLGALCSPCSVVLKSFPSDLWDGFFTCNNFSLHESVKF